MTHPRYLEFVYTFCADMAGSVYLVYMVGNMDTQVDLDSIIKLYNVS